VLHFNGARKGDEACPVSGASRPPRAKSIVTLRALSMKSCAAGLIMRPFKVTRPRWTGSAGAPMQHHWRYSGCALSTGGPCAPPYIRRFEMDHSRI
jgi:hypothetical protein